MRHPRLLLSTLFFASLAATCAIAASDENEGTETNGLDIERLVASPSLDGPALTGLQIAPDASRVTFLRGKQSDFRVQDLWVFDPDTAEASLLVDSADLLGGEEQALSEVEKARRERQRIYARGIVDYHWSAGSDALLFALGGDLYYLPLGGEPRRLTRTEAAETDPKFSPEGNYVSFIREQNLYIIEVASGEQRQLTEQGGDTIRMGMAEFVAQEEMDRDTGYRWAPDDSAIALTRVDQSPVAVVERYELGAAGGVTTIEQRYPFAGTDNVRIDLGVVGVDGGAIRWIDLGDNEDIYLARVEWLPDSRRLSFQRQSRDQKRLELIVVDTVSGEQTTLVTETADTWINLAHDLTFLEQTERFIWSSERSGFRHLYLYATDGTRLGPLTAGEWVVDGVQAVDEDAGRVYFTGFADTPLERHLYSVALQPGVGQPRRLTRETGWHEVEVSAAGGLFVDRYSAPRVPPAVALKSLTGEPIASIAANRLDQSHPYAPYLANHADKTYGTLTATHATPLHYSLARPADFDPEQRYPAIVNVYGGPGAQRVRKRWAIDFDQILARNGFLVFKLDNRGSTHRGKAFEDVLYRNLAGPEVEDQRAAVEWLAGRAYVDARRIGVYGWSYGGYMTLQLLARAGDTLAAGLSVAPVTDWRLYDTHYTERYLGKPGEDGVYERASVLAHIEAIRPGRLMLVHGMADDNVFFDHTVKAMSALQQKRIAFELMTYPGKRHRIAGEDTRAHLWNDALEFFERKLRHR